MCTIISVDMSSAKHFDDGVEVLLLVKHACLPHGSFSYGPYLTHHDHPFSWECIISFSFLPSFFLLLALGLGFCMLEETIGNGRIWFLWIEQPEYQNTASLRQKKNGNHLIYFNLPLPTIFHSVEGCCCQPDTNRHGAWLGVHGSWWV